MNHTVQSVVAVSPAKEKLLTKAVDHALASGIADLSLREIAAAVGSSHRMLIYHFGSREGLLVEVAQAVEDAERARLAGSLGGDPREFWRALRDERLWPQERLFFELYSSALLRRPGTDSFLEGIVDSWVAPVAEVLVGLGRDERTARAEARLGLAVVRGLLLDLLATGDVGAVDDAYDRFVTAIFASPTPTEPPGDP